MSTPLHDPDLEARREPVILSGEVPSPTNPPPGCRFSTRCPMAAPESRSASHAGANCALGTGSPVMLSSTTHAQRGRDGHLNILYRQASPTVNPYLSGGTKDIEGASLVIEPLAHSDENGNMVPVRVEEIPTLENGASSPFCAASPGSSPRASSGRTVRR